MDSSRLTGSDGLEQSPSQKFRKPASTARIHRNRLVEDFLQEVHNHDPKPEPPTRTPPQQPKCYTETASSAATLRFSSTFGSWYRMAGWRLQGHRFCQSWASLKAARSDLKRQGIGAGRYPCVAQNIHIVVVVDTYTTDPRQAHGKKKSMAWRRSTAARYVPSRSHRDDDDDDDDGDDDDGDEDDEDEEDEDEKDQEHEYEDEDKDEDGDEDNVRTRMVMLMMAIRSHKRTSRSHSSSTGGSCGNNNNNNTKWHRQQQR